MQIPTDPNSSLRQLGVEENNNANMNGTGLDIFWAVTSFFAILGFYHLVIEGKGLKVLDIFGNND